MGWSFSVSCHVWDSVCAYVRDLVCGVACAVFSLCCVHSLVCVMSSLQSRFSSLLSEHASLRSIGKSLTRAQGKGPRQCQISNFVCRPALHSFCAWSKWEVDISMVHIEICNYIHMYTSMYIYIYIYIHMAMSLLYPSTQIWWTGIPSCHFLFHSWVVH